MRRLAALLARNVRDVGVLHACRINRAAQVAADDEARAVAVGQHDQASLLRDGAQQRELLLVVENAEPGGLQNWRVHDLRQRVFVIPPFDDDGFPNFQHVTPPLRSAAASP